MKSKNSIIALICILGLKSQAIAQEMKLLCVPKETQNQPFKCLITNFDLKMQVSRSPGRTELVTNADRHITVAVIVDQDGAGLSEVAMNARGFKGNLDFLNSKRNHDGREVPTQLNIFDEGINFSGKLICQGIHGATSSVKNSCGI